jgi:hypothetical protein
MFIVVANALMPGATVAWVTRRLGLQKAEAPAPQAVLAIESRLTDVLLCRRGWWWRRCRSEAWTFREGWALTLIVREPTRSSTGVDGATGGKSCVCAGAAGG